MCYHSLIQTVFCTFVWLFIFCFFYPSVIVILGRKSGLRQATLPQPSMKVRLGHILALNVPKRWTSRQQLPKEKKCVTQDVTPRSSWNKRFLLVLSKSLGTSILWALNKCLLNLWIKERMTAAWHVTPRGHVCPMAQQQAFPTWRTPAVNSRVTFGQKAHAIRNDRFHESHSTWDQNMA